MTTTNSSRRIGLRYAATHGTQWISATERRLRETTRSQLAWGRLPDASAPDKGQLLPMTKGLAPPSCAEVLASRLRVSARAANHTYFRLDPAQPPAGESTAAATPPGLSSRQPNHGVMTLRLGAAGHVALYDHFPDPTALANARGLRFVSPYDAAPPADLTAIGIRAPKPLFRQPPRYLMAGAIQPDGTCHLRTFADDMPSVGICGGRVSTDAAKLPSIAQQLTADGFDAGESCSSELGGGALNLFTAGRKARPSLRGSLVLLSHDNTRVEDVLIPRRSPFGGAVCTRVDADVPAPDGLTLHLQDGSSTYDVQLAAPHGRHGHWETACMTHTVREMSLPCGGKRVAS